MWTGLGPVVAISTIALPMLPMPLAGGVLDRDRLHTDLESLKDSGVQYVDLTDTWLPLSRATEHDIDALHTTLDSLELKPCGVSIVGRSILDPMHGVADQSHVRCAIEIAAALRAPVVSMGFQEAATAHAKTAPVKQVYRRNPVPLVRSLARQAEVVQVSIALGLYAGTHHASARLAVDMVQQIGMANVGISINTGSRYRSPSTEWEGWAESIEQCLPFVNYWRAIGDPASLGERAQPIGTNGRGHPRTVANDWNAVTAARATGYDGSVVVEPGHDADGDIGYPDEPLVEENPERMAMMKEEWPRHPICKKES